MIVECSHCGAPLDVKQGEKLNKCRYCGSTNQVNRQRTIAFETPQGWRPPPKWTPPAHFAAGSAQVLTYKAAASGVAMVVGISAVGVLVVVGIIVASVVSSVTTAATEYGKVEDEVSRATKQANDAIAQALAQASAAQDQAQRAVGGIPGAGGAQLGLLSNAGVVQALAMYKKTLGARTLKVRRLTLHDSHSSVKVQSPKNPKHLDGYDYINGAVDGPDPEHLSGREKTDLESFLFDPEQTALMQLDTLKQTAMSKLAFEEAKITHVIAERRGKVEILVYASSPRESGYVSFDEKGKVIRVAK
jgi:hypothetical protein